VPPITTSEVTVVGNAVLLRAAEGVVLDGVETTEAQKLAEIFEVKTVDCGLGITVMGREVEAVKESGRGETFVVVGSGVADTCEDTDGVYMGVNVVAVATIVDAFEIDNEETLAGAALAAGLVSATSGSTGSGMAGEGD
jgi:hypothetical protein